MRRKKALFQPWNHIAFRADPFLRRLTNLQVWMYCTLLHAAFVCPQRPNLPDDDEQLWKLADCSSRGQWMTNKDPVRSMFKTATVDNEAVLQHPRLVRDFERLTSGTVYFIQGESTRLIKIGFTDRAVKARCAILQVGSPDKLIILGSIDGSREIESYLHDIFAKHRVIGEWFRPAVEILEFITEHIRG